MNEMDRKLPLEGITVIDFATLLAGPVAATFLGDFGATVIKVEQPKIGDPTRGLPMIEDGRHFSWLNEGRNKKTVTLNLRTDEGQKLAHRLVEKADVVMLNFRPGQAEKWNLGAEDLHRTNPNLIISQISAYGQTGPYREKGGFDRNVSAFSGLTYATGYPDQPPVRSGYAVVDYMTAYLNAYGIMMALYNRDVNNSGGEVIDVSLSEAAFRSSESALIDYSLTGKVRERSGNRNTGFVPAEDFDTKDGRILVINAGTDRLFGKLVAVMGQPEILQDPRFENRFARTMHQDALYEIIGNWVKERTAAEGLQVMDEAGIPADLVRDIAELAHDPHMRERDAVMEVTDPEKGKVLIPGVFPKMKKAPGRVKFLGARLGEYNQEIFGDYLGLSAEELSELKEKGVI
ncbi:MAG: CoA transferase [Deltaproteobacteria bacterium]|jgi:crotonobetainyl-CoA:carnitine CoA-transferase CaiB-like acyl-CoA transferase|nr:CoA transferase [Deltaproteobacteria bacterium]MBT4265142.1 CoA transferase [Deltaproteobacteria bacterium]MBT4641428.1 CoA transferase [Deltaproteobacteria bacterium]MBT6500309.1 CoA transferase [Deltaproteobacteria bacterium]MBT6614922.1 CoA transferase [Deltaproteobacteria bacterium]